LVRCWLVRKATHLQHERPAFGSQSLLQPGSSSCLLRQR
jgi:hypothetical protein